MAISEYKKWDLFARIYGKHFYANTPVILILIINLFRKFIQANTVYNNEYLFEHYI